jgi:hypothetical protein
MKRETDAPIKKLGELIDRIEQIREELLAIQRSMEKMEAAESDVSEDQP